MRCSICFVPLGGLCNRMRAMASGVYLAKKLNGSIFIYWKKNSECFADFSELFCSIDSYDVTVKAYTWKESYLAVSRKKNFHIPKVIRGFFFDNQISGKNEYLDEDQIEALGGGKIFITSGYSLTTRYPLTELFIPTPEIMKQINRIKERFTENVIGIHIRRGDNIQSIRKNKVEDYFRFMDEEIDANPGTIFYLATDSADVKQEMISRYGDRIIFHDAVLERHSVQGMEDAVVDLWCLSSTKRIIGSYYSSYSDLAAELGGIELSIIE